MMIACLQSSEKVQRQAPRPCQCLVQRVCLKRACFTSHGGRINPACGVVQALVLERTRHSSQAAVRPQFPYSRRTSPGQTPVRQHQSPGTWTTAGPARELGFCRPRPAGALLTFNCSTWSAVGGGDSRAGWTGGLAARSLARACATIAGVMSSGCRLGGSYDPSPIPMTAFVRG